MSATSERNEELAGIGRLLETYGADVERWPATARLRLQRASEASPDATRKLVSEARALAIVLDRAPTVSTDVGRLADRITAAALAQRQQDTPAAAGQGNVIAWPGVRARPDRSPATLGRWRSVAALMAACLVAGIILGGSFRVDPVLVDVGDAVGLHADLPGTSVALADDSGDEGPL